MLAKPSGLLLQIFRAGVIQLTFHESPGTPAPVLDLTAFRITGGVLWNHVDRYGLIARFTCGDWKHRGRHYPSITVAGACCLVFGIAREATISEQTSLVSVTGKTLRANGVAIAEFDEKQDLWHGLIRPISWHALRIVCATAASALTEATPTVTFNPWDYPSDDSSSAIST